MLEVESREDVLGLFCTYDHLFTGWIIRPSLAVNVQVTSMINYQKR